VVAFYFAPRYSYQKITPVPQQNYIKGGFPHVKNRYSIYDHLFDPDSRV